MHSREFRRRVRDSLYKDTRFDEKSIGAIIKNPVLIVGQNPGRQRKGEESCVVWEGNRSSDFLMSCLDGYSNIYLTNVCNYQEVDADRLMEGLNDLRDLINRIQPKDIICLGLISSAAVNAILQDFSSEDFNGVINVHKLSHPSYVLRFNKDVEEYKDKIVNIVSRKWKT